MWRVKCLKQSFKFGTGVSSFIGVFITFFPFGQKWWIGIMTVLLVFIIASLGALLCFLLRKHRKIASFANHSISATYGNIFSVKSKEKPVIVIPVNTSFDYIVEGSLNVKDPIVNPTSLQGQLIKKLTNLESNNIKSLGAEIEDAIKIQGLVAESVINKRGNQNVYKLGSYIFLERDDCSYMLFALTDFDEHNVVVPKPVDTFAKLINELVSDINNCQGRPVYIPIMGVGLSGFGIDHKNSFSLIKEALLSKKLTLRNDVTIVIYDGDREKVSIDD